MRIEEIMAIAQVLTSPFEQEYIQRKDEILHKWRGTKFLPRKAKKKLRKSLQLDYSINEYFFNNMFHYAR